jgi:membrane protein DedA with SNARE-associated domain
MDEQPPGRPPRARPSRRTLALIITPIIAITVIGTIGNAIHPTLVKDHPLWLVAMEPRNRFLILVAGKVDYLPFVIVATVRRLFSDPLFYALGYLYGDAGVRWIENKMGEGGGFVRAIERGFAKAAPIMVFLFPGAIVCVLAGATGMNPILFLALNVAGTVTVVTVVYRFAEIVEGPVNAINGFYGNNSKWLTALSVIVTIIWLLDQRRRGKGEVQSVSSIESELERARRETPGE